MEPATLPRREKGESKRKEKEKEKAKHETSRRRRRKMRERDEFAMNIYTSRVRPINSMGMCDASI